MSYLNRSHVLEACEKMQAFYSQLADLYKSHGMDIESNRGRRNILMSEPMEIFLAEALSKSYPVISDGRTGKADIVVHLTKTNSKELECKLTSPHASSGSICFQTDFETLEKKGNLDYIYLVANEDFSGFCAIYFEGLTIDDFRGVSPGARGKVQMFKHKGMKKATVLMGEVIDLKEQRISRIQSNIIEAQEENTLLCNKLENKISLLRDSQIYDRNKINDKIDRSKYILANRINKMKNNIKLSIDKKSRYTFRFEKMEK